MMEVPNSKMSPGHLLEYRCPNTGLVFQWRVLGVYLGGVAQESLIEIESVFLAPGSDSSGLPYKRLLVPEPMTRMMKVIVPGVGVQNDD